MSPITINSQRNLISRLILSIQKRLLAS